MNRSELTDPPALGIDAELKRLYGGSPLDQRQKNERSIVWNLCRHLNKHGFKAVAVYDGDDMVEVSDTLGAMELIFNLDQASLRVRKTGFAEHGILLILGNGNEGLDLITDWNYSEDNLDGFGAAMEAFDVDALYEQGD